MKAFLMHQDQDVGRGTDWTANNKALFRDLDLARILTAMSATDPYLYEVAQKTLLAPLTNVDAITYRQQLLLDCLENPGPVRDLYTLTEETLAAEKKIYRSIFYTSPDTVLRQSIESLEMLIGMLRRLRTIADTSKDAFQSPGFTRFFTMIIRELDEDYFQVLTGHLEQLRFKKGILIGARLGQANKGTGYTLRKPTPDGRHWYQRLNGPSNPTYSFEISDRDESGFRALSELKGRGINLAANALAESDNHIVSFFTMLRAELAFYIGCLNLRQALAATGGHICIPKPEKREPDTLSARNMYDLSLALAGTTTLVGNDLDADGKNLIVVTGANEGGKSTFMRSLGTAQLMMQCGMFVCADYFSSSLVDGVYTHYKREEDESLTSGKLDEELERMSTIADTITPHSMVLFNESFSATNEREGSAIARGIIAALLETGMRVVFVTHFFDLSHGIYAQQLPGARFLQAERQSAGQRTYKIVPGEPVFTSYGADLYEQIFSPAPNVPTQGADSIGEDQK